MLLNWSGGGLQVLQEEPVAQVCQHVAVPSVRKAHASEPATEISIKGPAGADAGLP
jgi:hypothetical protein